MHDDVLNNDFGSGYLKAIADPECLQILEE